MDRVALDLVSVSTGVEDLNVVCAAVCNNIGRARDRSSHLGVRRSIDAHASLIVAQRVYTGCVGPYKVSHHRVTSSVARFIDSRNIAASAETGGRQLVAANGDAREAKVAGNEVFGHGSAGCATNVDATSAVAQRR